MSEEFRKLNNTIAKFMLASLAISGAAFAVVNENMIADAMSGIKTSAANVPVMVLYGVPSAPKANPKMPVRVLYGVPTLPKIKRAKQQKYNMPAKDKENLQNSYNTNKHVNENNNLDSKQQINYEQPVITPENSIQNSNKF